jgi:hypothetical protein
MPSAHHFDPVVLTKQGLRRVIPHPTYKSSPFDDRHFAIKLLQESTDPVVRLRAERMRLAFDKQLQNDILAGRRVQNGIVSYKYAHRNDVELDDSPFAKAIAGIAKFLNIPLAMAMIPPKDEL